MISLVRHNVRNARRVVAKRQADLVQAHLVDAGYDDFIPHVARVTEPSILLGTAEDSAGRPVAVPMSVGDLATHMLVTGATGTGKTTFASWLLANAMRHGFATGTLDCKAGYHELALRFAAATAYHMPARERAAFIRRLVVVNPFGETLVPLNVCRVPPGSTAEMMSYDIAMVLQKLFDGSPMGFQSGNILQNLLLLLSETGLSIIEGADVLEDALLRNALLARVSNREVREFFGRTYATVPAGSRDAIVTRLRSLARAESLKLMLGAEELLDFQGVFDRGAPLCIFLGMGQGVAEELVDILGTLILQLVFQGARGGAVNRRKPYLLIADEFFHLLDIPELAKRFERGLDALRAFGVHLGLVMHQLSQVPAPLQYAIQTHCSLQALFRTSGRNAQLFAESLPETDPDVVREALKRTGRMPARFEMRAQIVERLTRLPDRTCYLCDRRKPYRPLKLRVPDVPAPHVLAGLTERELEAFMEDHGIAAGGLGLPRTTLKRQIDERQRRLRELVNPPIVVQTPPAEEATPGASSNGHSHRSRIG